MVLSSLPLPSPLSLSLSFSLSPVQHPGLKILRSDSSSSISSRIVTVTPGYFCCRGIYTSSLSLTPFLHLFSRPHFHPAVCLHLHLKPQLSSCVSIYVCVLFITVVRSVCIGIDVSLVCVSHVCVMLSSLTKQKQDLAKPWS